MFRLVIKGDLGFETWQDIPGYEGLYQASTYGRIKSIKRKKILKPSFNKGGYAQVKLCKNGFLKTISVHLLVARTFLPSPLTNSKERIEVNHKSEIKADNRIENLEYLSQSDNLKYGTGYIRRRKSNINHPKKSKIVVQYDLNNNFIKQYPSCAEVKRKCGFNDGYISCCCRGIYEQAYGYIWKYA